MNGDIKGDKEGELTYTGGREESVIDYVIGDERIREKMRRVVVEEKVDSDHHLIVVWVRKGREIGKGEERVGEEEEAEGYGQKKERRSLGSYLEKREDRDKGIKDNWGELKRSVGDVLEKIEKEERKEEW